jgi:hypothetical protein
LAGCAITVFAISKRLMIHSALITSTPTRCHYSV